MWKIKKETIESICIASRNNYPNEFLSFLGGNKEKKVINELVVLPAIYGKSFATVDLLAMPFDKGIIGTIHSHPSPNNYPSLADSKMFSARGEIHLIAGYPFNPENIRAFNRKTEEIEWAEE